ncbi:diguanylate cyclase [Mobilitalea sibirica]|uniref:Stage 0 sporulation protein A homolog n=1 Tax=Mobilitalea sibirica TaxID=1462919 RepID=A0A8J7KZ79_9FIRM|nr:diguanylate cyclase [Mobilitalea sibirica]MBH1939588.1 diguanylate cyclase [Mobilitalea sibirica]
MEKVMIIDDSPIDRKMIKLALKSKLPDIQLIEADHGKNIEEILYSQKVDVCILDIMMPERNGLEILKEIKEKERYRDIPIIVCSGLYDCDILEKALELGAHDYFSKPLGKKEISISLPLKVKNAIELMKWKEKILYLSYHDVLTGLYNRRFVEEELIQLDELEKFPISIILGDVNGLKHTNDVFGHEAGDEMLKRIAHILQKECVNGRVARYGGDEFVVLLPETNIMEAKKMIESIKDHCITQTKDSVKLSISLGCAMKSKGKKSMKRILQEAEDMMYNDKLQYRQIYQTNP